MTVSTLVTGCGVLLLVIAAVGLFRLPDALSRQHAATKSVTLALTLILVGAAIEADEWSFRWRIATILVILFATVPASAHMLARAAARHAYTPEELGESTPQQRGSSTQSQDGDARQV